VEIVSGCGLLPVDLRWLPACRKPSGEGNNKMMMELKLTAEM
jgi:hypothetical protein